MIRLSSIAIFTANNNFFAPNNGSDAKTGLKIRDKKYVLFTVTFIAIGLPVPYLASLFPFVIQTLNFY